MMSIRFLGAANSPRWWAILAALILLIAPSFSHATSGDDGDRLVYAVNNFDGEIAYVLYDPQTRENTPILTDNSPISLFSVSAEGHLAFASWRDGNNEVYVVDTSSVNSSPVNITQSPTTDDYPLAWSSDGRYLAFGSYDENYGLIFVWDGETAKDITPNDLDGAVDHYRATWSSDGRLAFLVWYTVDNKENTSDIFLWDGYTTTDLSQNPIGEERDPTWNTNGEIAFLSARGGGCAHDIFVWDGMSVANGVPDRDSFINVLPELTTYFSYPIWTNDGRLAFNATGPQDNHRQIYVWDGQTATNVSQNPDHHNGTPAWSADGRLAFATFFSSEQVVYVRDVDNRLLLRVDGQYPPAWSPGGYLMFCSRGWTLNVWDGQEVVEIEHGGEIWAEWQGGGSVFCSSG